MRVSPERLVRNAPLPVINYCRRIVYIVDECLICSLIDPVHVGCYLFYAGLAGRQPTVVSDSTARTVT